MQNMYVVANSASHPFLSSTTVSSPLVLPLNYITCRRRHHHHLHHDHFTRYFRLTMDVFTEIAFGVDLQSITRDKPHPFATAFDDIQVGSVCKM